MLHRHRLTGILADDMGLGKTMQAIALLLKTREDEGPKPSLVIAPTSVVTVWRDEVERFAPMLNLVLWHGPPKVRHELDISNADIIVTSYGILRRDSEILKEVSFRYVILDEAQSAKNAASQNATAVRELTSERRLALTGTPIENRPEELWSTFDFWHQAFLAVCANSGKRYARPIGRGEREPLELLSARVTPLILRRLKGEVAKELPDKIESVVRCEMGEEQRALYDHLSGQLRQEVESKIEQIGINKAHLDILAALTKLVRHVATRLCSARQTVPMCPTPQSWSFLKSCSEKLWTRVEQLSSSASSWRCKNASSKSSKSLSGSMLAARRDSRA